MRRWEKKWYIYASEEIPPHGEIFIDYGRSYFLTRLQALPREERGITIKNARFSELELFTGIEAPALSRMADVLD